MLFVLGVGSAVALASAIVTVICDQFHWKHWKVALATTIIGFSLGLAYVTPVLKIYFPFLFFAHFN